MPVPKSIETLLELLLAVARSKFPSLLKSPTAIDTGLIPPVVGKLVAGPNEPVPVPKSIETLLEAKLAVARSKFPSLLKSPTAIENGKVPPVVGKLVAGPNEKLIIIKLKIIMIDLKHFL